MLGPDRQRVTAMILLGSAVLLAGCTGTTYGTGVSPGAQTLQDLAGIAGASGTDREPIDYTSRAPVVAPPVAGQLPPPGSGQQQVAAANWPNDPDEAARRRAASRSGGSQNASSALNVNSPRFRLPAGSSRPPTPGSGPMDAESVRNTPEQERKAREAFADAKGDIAFDADGNPIRRYLSEPPVEYRVPDPNAPTEIVEDECKRVFRWPWQDRKPGEC